MLRGDAHHQLTVVGLTAASPAPARLGLRATLHGAERPVMVVPLRDEGWESPLGR